MKPKITPTPVRLAVRALVNYCVEIGTEGENAT